MLLNSRELFSYDVDASDGRVGHVDDLLIDDETWKVRHFVVNTGSFLSLHEVLVEPAQVKEVTHPDDVLIVVGSKSEMEQGALAASDPPVSVHHNDPSSPKHDPHLRSARSIGGYSVEAEDSSLGHVHGIVVDEDSWEVRYLVVDTGELLTAKQVLIIPSAVKKIDWEDETIWVSLPISKVRECPEYDSESELSRQYEGFLHDYYGWLPYW